MKIKPHSEENRSLGSVYQCPECLAGVMRMEFVTYFTWLNKELITVPNFPAWLCDLCGRREFDPRAITWLNTLLNPATGRRSDRGSNPRPSVRSERPHPDP
jgi:YgiT-type zinc finger domain-containing protein